MAGADVFEFFLTGTTSHRFRSVPDLDIHFSFLHMHYMKERHVHSRKEGGGGGYGQETDLLCGVERVNAHARRCSLPLFRTGPGHARNTRLS